MGKRIKNTFTNSLRFYDNIYLLFMYYLNNIIIIIIIEWWIKSIKLCFCIAYQNADCVTTLASARQNSSTHALYLYLSLSLASPPYFAILSLVSFIIHFADSRFSASAHSVFCRLLLLLSIGISGRILNDIPIEKDNAKFFPLRKLTGRKTDNNNSARCLSAVYLHISLSAFPSLFCSIVNRSVWTALQQNPFGGRCQQLTSSAAVTTATAVRNILNLTVGISTSMGIPMRVLLYFFYAKFADIISIKA